MRLLNRFQFGMRGMLASMALAAFLLAWYSGWIQFAERQSSLVASFYNQHQVCVWEFSQPVNEVFLRIDGKKDHSITALSPFNKNATFMFATQFDKDGSATFDLNLCNTTKTRKIVGPVKFGSRTTFRYPHRIVRMSEPTAVLYTIQWHGTDDEDGQKTPGRKIEVVVSR